MPGSTKVASRRCSAALSAGGSVLAILRRRIATNSPATPAMSASGGSAPQQQRMQFEAWLEQHEFAVARHQKIEHLAVAVARLQPFAHQHAQIMRQFRC